MKDKLDKFINTTVTENNTEAESIFKAFLIEKMTKIVQEFTKDSKIKLDGDDVIIFPNGNGQGIKVGSISVDPSNWESGIDFVSDDKKYSKEFDDIPALYAFIAKRYNITEGYSITEDVKGAVDALRKQALKRKERMKRWIDVNKKSKNVDGSQGEYDKNDLVKKHKRPKGG